MNGIETPPTGNRENTLLAGSSSAMRTNFAVAEGLKLTACVRTKKITAALISLLKYSNHRRRFCDVTSVTPLLA
jgi:hypothetical protein